MTVSFPLANNTDRPFFTPEHIAYQASLRKFLQKEAAPYVNDWKKAKMVPREFWKKVGDNGFLCQWLAAKYGGQGVDFGFAAILAEEFQRVDSGLLGFQLQNGITSPYIDTFGTDAQKDKYLPGMITGDVIAALAMTESNAGSDLASMTTYAVKDGDNYIVNGSKTFITNGYCGDVYIVAVKTDRDIKPPHKGISLLLIDGDTPGFEKVKLNKIGMEASDTSTLYFDNCVVPQANLLGEEGKGFVYLMQKLQQERLQVAIFSLAAIEDMLDMTYQYTQERQLFGKRLGEFQNTQYEMADMITEATVGRHFIDSLIVRHINKEDLVTEVSMAKYWASELSKKIAGRCLQIFGGYGYMQEYKISQLYCDLAIMPLFGGTSQVQKGIIAKNLKI